MHTNAYISAVKAAFVPSLRAEHKRSEGRAALGSQMEEVAPALVLGSLRVSETGRIYAVLRRGSLSRGRPARALRLQAPAARSWPRSTSCREVFPLDPWWAHVLGEPLGGPSRADVTPSDERGFEGLSFPAPCSPLGGLLCTRLHSCLFPNTRVMWFSIMEPAGSTPRGGGPPLPLSAEAAPRKDPEASRANSILCRGRTDFPELGCRGKGSDGQRVPPGSHTVGAGFLSLLPHGTHSAVVQTPTSHPEPSQDRAMESSPGNVLRAAGLWAVASAGGPCVPWVRDTLAGLRACGVWPLLSLARGRAAHRLTKLLVSQGSSSHGMGGHVPPGHGRRCLSDVAPARCWPAFPYSQ